MLKWGETSMNSWSRCCLRCHLLSMNKVTAAYHQGYISSSMRCGSLILLACTLYLTKAFWNMVRVKLFGLITVTLCFLYQCQINGWNILRIFSLASYNLGWDQAVCRPPLHLWYPRSHHTLFPTVPGSTPPLDPPNCSFPLPTEYQWCCKLQKWNTRNSITEISTFVMYVATTTVVSCKYAPLLQP